MLRVVQRILYPALVGLFAFSTPVPAQVTRSDSAAVLLEAARALEAGGERSAAMALYRLIVERFRGEPAAAIADSLRSGLSSMREQSSGRTELMVWNTLYGAWLGVAIPAALDADEPEPYGAGLLLGTATGLFGARAYATATGLTTGGARAIIFGEQWGTFQGFTIQQVFDIGERTETFCFSDGTGGQICNTFQDESDTAPFAAAVVGGLAGIVVGATAANALDISAGDATLVNHAAFWGTWYGFATAVVAHDDALDDDGDNVLAFMLLGGNGALVASALATKRLDWTPARVRLVSIAGVAGLVAGFGLDLLLDVEDEDAAILLPTVTSFAALAAAAHATRNDPPERRAAGSAAPASALLALDGGLRLGMPTPRPTVLRRSSPAGRPIAHLALRVPLFDARF